MSLFITNFLEKYYQELGAFILIKPNIFLSSPSVGAEHFKVDGRHVLRTSSVEAAHICGVYVILILGT